MATARINPAQGREMVRGPIGESPSGGSVYEVKLYNDSGELVTHHVDDRFVSNADGHAPLRAVRRQVGRSAPSCG